ncbi:MAG: guanylate kinase [Epsilonproteobacteria bacterium]|nr:guanylate kinase [Campylobacterota bacterium]
MIKKGALLVISGPSGAGKSTLIKEILEKIPNVYFSISTTTRSKREGEVEGKDYFFVEKEEFKKEIERGNFLEWAEVHGNFYGTSITPVKKALQEGKLVLFDIDVQGFKLIKQSSFSPLLTSLFITPPSLKELERRLLQRGSDSSEVIQKRLKNAQKEIKQMYLYDYILVNEDLEEAKRFALAVARSAFLKWDKKEVDDFVKRIIAD